MISKKLSSKNHETNNISLKLVPLSKQHINYIMQWINDPGISGYFAGMQKQISKSDELKYLEKLIKSKTDKVFSIFDGKNYVGQCSINQIYWPAKTGRLFLTIIKNYQGRGYGKLLIEKILDYGFNKLKLHKIYLIVRSENEKAINLYHRCGFRQEGVLKEEYFVKNRYWDMIRMAILEDTYRQWYKK